MADAENTQDEEEIVTDDQHDNDQEQGKEDDNFDWKADALKHRAISTRLKVKLAKVPSINKVPNEAHKIDDEIVQDVRVLKEEREKRQFGFEHKLSPEETDYAFKFAGGKPSKETIEDPFFKGGIESLRSRQRLENNTPGSSSRSSVFTEKSFAELDEAGRRKAFEERGKALRK